MAIKRCPYCRALIDEKEQYCNNCGTQLLFPDDGAVEEEIPGDKIIDADIEEKDYEIPEPGADKPVENPEDEDEDELEDDKGKSPDSDIKPPPEDDGAPENEDEDDEEDEEPEEVVLVDEAERDNIPELPFTTRPGTSEIPVIFSAPGEEEPPPGEEPKPEREEVAWEPEAEAATPLPTKKPLTFDTSDLDKIGRTAELGKEQVENFLEVLKKREEESRLSRAGTREAEESLPPWAAEIKDGSVEPSPEVKVEMMREDDIEDRELEEPEAVDVDAELEEKEPVRPPRARVADSGMGLPEKVTQAALPFEREISREDEPERTAPPPAAGRRRIVREDEGAEELEEETEERKERPRPPFKLSVFLKAKSFDVLFVAVFWLVSLWIAARSMDVTLFQMLGVASSGLLAYFGALLILYFFLFYFFLGETLGDRLFRDED
jgi:hypothetical protein